MINILDKYIEKIVATKFEYIPVVLGRNINALGIVRSLGENGLPVIVADHEDGVAFHSKYSCPIKIENCETDKKGFLEKLYKISTFLESMKKKGIIYCSSDAYLFAIGENICQLKKKFKIMMNDWNNVKKCIDKSFLYKEADRLGIPYPGTFYAKNSNEMIQGTSKLKYPILIKPAVTVGFSNVYKKAIIVDDEKELFLVRDKINHLGLGEHELIMQEMIPGLVKNLYTFTSYSDENGDVKAYSIGYKIRQSPPETGTITSGKVVNHHELAKLGITFIKEFKFHGVANTEFKFDQRDSKFKLIEINPRPGLWNYSATAAGVNISWIAYQNTALGLNKPIKFSNKEVIWIYDFMDIFRALFSNKHGHDKSRINFFHWFKSVKGDKTYAIWKINDPKPFIYLVLSLLSKLIRKIKKITT